MIQVKHNHLPTPTEVVGHIGDESRQLLLLVMMEVVWKIQIIQVIVLQKL